MDILAEALIDILNKEGPIQLKNRYQIGEIDYEPSESELPLCMIFTDSSNIQNDGFGDSIGLETRIVQMQVVVNYKKEPRTKKYAYGSTLYNMILARDENWRLKDKTILKVLFDNRRMSDTRNIFIDPQNNGISFQNKSFFARTSQSKHSISATISFEVEIS